MQVGTEMHAFCILEEPCDVTIVAYTVVVPMSSVVMRGCSWTDWRTRINDLTILLGSLKALSLSESQ